ncbi:hypothetical protein B0J17DRAFT_684700 [Rhizoctonia solani]|nr:hypothetical protein B0J17DRAFT_684700 [Rhizoctonia solani]
MIAIWDLFPRNIRKSLQSGSFHFHLLNSTQHAARKLHTWSRYNHPNIMPLLRLAVFRDRIGMVATWMKHGGLPDYLQAVSGVNQFNMCVQICKGLLYLIMSHRSL